MRRKSASCCDLSSEGSFESYLSTVTKNGLGMLVVLAMASTFAGSLTLGEARFHRDLGAPIVQTASPDAEAVPFECRGGRIFPIVFDEEKDRAFLVDIFAFFSAADADRDALARKFNARDYGHRYYTFEVQVKSGHPVHPEEPAIVFLPRPGVGETLAEAQQPQSEFRKRLEKMNKGKDVLALVVWSDSFPCFRDLREWLRKDGYQISWQPIDRPRKRLNPWKFKSSGLVDIDR